MGNKIHTYSASFCIWHKTQNPKRWARLRLFRPCLIPFLSMLWTSYSASDVCSWATGIINSKSALVSLELCAYFILGLLARGELKPREACVQVEQVLKRRDFLFRYCSNHRIIRNIIQTTWDCKNHGFPCSNPNTTQGGRQMNVQSWSPFEHSSISASFQGQLPPLLTSWSTVPAASGCLSGISPSNNCGAINSALCLPSEFSAFFHAFILELLLLVDTTYVCLFHWVDTNQLIQFVH